MGRRKRLVHRHQPVHDAGVRVHGPGGRSLRHRARPRPGRPRSGLRGGRDPRLRDRGDSPHPGTPVRGDGTRPGDVGRQRGAGGCARHRCARGRREPQRSGGHRLAGGRVGRRRRLDDAHRDGGGRGGARPLHDHRDGHRGVHHPEHRRRRRRPPGEHAAAGPCLPRGGRHPRGGRPGRGTEHTAVDHLPDRRRVHRRGRPRGARNRGRGRGCVPSRRGHRPHTGLHGVQRAHPADAGRDRDHLPGRTDHAARLRQQVRSVHPRQRPAE